MGIRTRRNWKFRDIITEPSVPFMREVGLNVATRIQNRTMSGLDQNNRRFKPYAKSYRRYGQKVDLYDTGEMLNDLGVIKAASRFVRIGFGPAMEQRAAYHDGPRLTPGNPVPRRRFMGVPDSWVRDIIAKIRKRVVRA